MKFKDKLRSAMLEKNISQTQMSELIGRSKASISQYLAGNQIPSEKTQKRIAVVLGKDPEYFSEKKKEKIVVMDAIPKMDVYTAAKLLGMNHVTVRKGLQQGRFPWGYAIQTSPDRWVYFINAKSFARIEGIEIEEKEKI